MRKNGCGLRIARVAVAEDDQRDGRQAEEDVVVAGDVVEDLIVAAEERDDDVRRTLQHDRDHRSVRARVHRRRAA